MSWSSFRPTRCLDNDVEVVTNADPYFSPGSENQGLTRSVCDPESCLATGIFCAERLVPGEMRSRMLLGRDAPGQPHWAKVKHKLWGTRTAVRPRCFTARLAPRGGHNLGEAFSKLRHRDVLEDHSGSMLYRVPEGVMMRARGSGGPNRARRVSHGTGPTSTRSRRRRCRHSASGG